MKAIVRTQYGPPDVLQFKDVAKPAPGDDELLIRIYAASVNPLDSFALRGAPLLRLTPGLRTPKYQGLGVDIAGRVAALGRHVKQFQPGDEVFGVAKSGGFAEYVCATEDKLTLKPANSSFEDAAAVPVAALTALQGLRDHGRIGQATRFWLLAPLVGWVPLRSRLPNSSGPKLRPCVAPGMWIPRARSARTASWITLARISPRAGSITT